MRVFVSWRVKPTSNFAPVLTMLYQVDKFLKYTASDFMICVSHFPMEWNEVQFKELIKEFGETEKCFLVRYIFLIEKSVFM